MISKETQQQHPRLVKLIEVASSTVERIFNKAGRVAAMFHYVKDNGDHVVTLAPVHLSKDVGFAFMRAVFEAEGAVAVMFIDEAWTFVTDDVEEAAAHLASGRGATDHPRRVEIVHFSAEDETGSLTATRKIERPPGQPPQLGPLEIMDSVWSVGRTVGLLPRPQKATLQ